MIERDAIVRGVWCEVVRETFVEVAQCERNVRFKLREREIR